WLSDLYTTCPSSYNFTGNTTGGTLYYSASNTITSTAVLRADVGTEVHYSAGNLIELKDGFRAQGQAFFEATIGPCPTDISEPLTEPAIPSGQLILDESRLQAILHRGD